MLTLLAGAKMYPVLRTSNHVEHTGYNATAVARLDSYMIFYPTDSDVARAIYFEALMPSSTMMDGFLPGAFVMKAVIG